MTSAVRLLALSLILLMEACSDPDTGNTDGPTDAADAVGSLEDGLLGDAPDDAVDVDVDVDGQGNDVSDSGDGDGTPDGIVGPDVLAPPKAPPELLLTINELPPHLNGDGLLPSGNGYRIWVNRANFTLDLMSEAPTDLDWSSLVLTCDAALTGPDGAVASPGSSLTSWVVPHPVTSEHRRIHFTLDVQVDELTEVTCSAEIGNALGTTSSDVSFIVATLEPERDPFVTNDRWLVTLSRDIFATTFTPNDDGTYTVSSTHVPEGNGVLDFDEAFIGLGFFSETNLTARAHVKKRLIERVRAEAHRIFQLDATGQPTAEGVPLSLVFEGDLGAPEASEWTPDGNLSMIALGGDGKPNDQNNGIVGRAALDWNNQEVEDNTVYDRGVYPAGIARAVLTQPVGALALADFLPATGAPIGDHPDDDELLDPELNPATLGGDKLHRYELMNFAIDMVGLAMATTLCHEIGHSLGLVPPGAPPQGMFAGMPKLDFIDNYIDGAHVDTAGLNIMQTGAVTNYVEAISQVAVFNPLNMAYLRRRIVVLAEQ